MSYRNGNRKNNGERYYGFLSGLPRTGSTLLTSILAQNPDVYVSGSSPLLRLMEGSYEVCNGYAIEGLARCRRTDFTDVMLSAIPDLYYKDVPEGFIVDKDRAWTRDRYNMLPHITAEPKIVVLLRSVEEIVQSFVLIKSRNGDVLPERYALQETVDPLCDAIADTIYSLESDDDRYLFGTYDQLVTDPDRFLDSVYEHWGWPRYPHILEEIEDRDLEDDHLMGTQGLHEVRSTIARRGVTGRLSPALTRLAREYDAALWEAVSNSMRNTPHRHM